MADKGSDPVALWQRMISEMEKGFSALANQTLPSPEFSEELSKTLDQAGGASAGAQKPFGDFMEKYLLNMNLPSRAQMTDITERLQNIEAQLGEIKAMLQQMSASGSPVGPAPAPRPPRSRRPPPSPGEQK